MNECKCLFEFDFRLIQNESAQKKEKIFLKLYDFDVTYNPIQRLYLSEDTTLLMEVINGFVARVYQRHDIDDLGYKTENEGGDKG